MTDRANPTEATTRRAQRLRTLESQIRQNYEAFLRTGFALKEIRDDRLFLEDGFETWDAYLKERVGAEFGIEERQARALISSAQIRFKLPDPPDANGTAVPLDDWSIKALNEFARLAPKDESRPGHPPDYDRLSKNDVQRVAKKVTDHCQANGIDKPTAPIVRKFVDEDLGVDRAAQAKATKEKREAARHPELRQFINELIAKIDVNRMNLETVSRDYGDPAWGQFNEDNPGLMDRLAAACGRLADVASKAAAARPPARQTRTA